MTLGICAVAVDKLVLTWKTIGTGDMNSSPITIMFLILLWIVTASFLVEIHIRNE
ncbi:hypothetical protein BCR33DRAFT_730152 [Rhizoclosmatium globosum]|uniref:Uncharacterized protein n=1 Tax=Rhizoclosmatium globosum TaxID=329046 RepID=A0A1Y2ADB1_9FUNG|nr:hypothetical protein BCR33DRAFT_730152 [Rhizoclosmatium globosum]|eukprot:ORY20533.1 hypothetical protein BCR33DRAFT_730152 [Rhizoclosmatium globosum]